MPDYSKNVIYKLVCKDHTITDIYIGSTCNFNDRKCKHKYNTTYEKGRAYTYNVYKFIRDTKGFDNWDMIEIEKKPCKDKREKDKIEHEFVQKYKPTLNTIQNVHQSPESKKEYKKKHNEANKVKYDKIKKAHYEKNKAILNEKFICECGRQYTMCHKDRHLKTTYHAVHSKIL